MKKQILSLGVMGLLLGGFLAIPNLTEAYRGNPNIQGPNYTPERHEEMVKAFETNDYQTWKSLMNGRGRVSEVVNEGNFNRFSEVHRLMLEGKADEAQKIRQELGLGQGMRPGNGYRQTR